MKLIFPGFLSRITLNFSCQMLTNLLHQIFLWNFALFTTLLFDALALSVKKKHHATHLKINMESVKGYWNNVIFLCAYNMFTFTEETSKKSVPNLHFSCVILVSILLVIYLIWCRTSLLICLHNKNKKYFYCDSNGFFFLLCQ